MDLHVISTWLKAITVVAIGCLLATLGLLWFSNYMSEGVVQATDLHSNVIVALSADSTVQQELRSRCGLPAGGPTPTSQLLSDGLLVTVPSLTRMHMPTRGDDPDIGQVTISDGNFKGRRVWVCKTQLALLHPWP